MKFTDLLRLRRGEGGGPILENVLRKLNLPLPEGVFSQLVRDHATTGFTQHIYGELDLHGTAWEETRLTASTIASASVHEEGLDLVEAVERQVAETANSGWGKLRRICEALAATQDMDRPSLAVPGGTVEASRQN